MIRINELSVWYREQPVLEKISLQIHAGECVLISGPSGCGKSTLAKSITGLIPQAIPSRMEGSIAVAGEDIASQSIPQLGRQIGMVFQNPSAQLFHLKVQEEIAFGPRNLGLPEAEVQARVLWSMQATGLLPLRESNPATLSGGQKQHVAIAAILAMHPKVLVLDEPTASLDVEGIKNVTRTLQNLKEQHHITIVIIEHRVAEIVELTDRVILMENGQIVEDDTPRNLLSKHQLRKRLGLRRPLTFPLDTWRSIIVEPQTPAPAAPPLLQLKDICASYGEKPILNQINVSIYPGDFVALVGNNGTGKSTLGLLIAGLLKPTAGEIRFQGQKKRPKPGKEVSLLFQNPTEQLFTDRVDDEVAFAPKNIGCFDSLRHQDLMAATDLNAFSQRSPINLSIGQQQRTALAACLSLQPQLLILDEPTLGQDWGHLQQMMALLDRLNKAGTTILMITHDYKLIHRYIQRILLLENGRIAMDGTFKKDRSIAMEAPDNSDIPLIKGVRLQKDASIPAFSNNLIE